MQEVKKNSNCKECGSKFNWYFKTSEKLCFKCKLREMSKVNQHLNRLITK